MTILVPSEHKLQALGGQPPSLRAGGALHVLEEELCAWLATCGVPEVLGDPASRDRLRIYVSRLKETDYSPEAMIIHLKQLFLGFRPQRAHEEPRALRALQEAVIRTCIEEYFGYRRG